MGSIWYLVWSRADSLINDVINGNESSSDAGVNESRILWHTWQKKRQDTSKLKMLACNLRHSATFFYLFSILYFTYSISLDK